MKICRPTVSNTSASVGTFSPLNAWLNFEPASNSFRSERVKAATLPRPSVVRSTLSSCMTATWPSAESLASSSMASAPCCVAKVKAASVFSGAKALEPRWAKIAGRLRLSYVNILVTPVCYLYLDEISARRSIEQFVRHGRLDRQVAGNIQDLVA